MIEVAKASYISKLIVTRRVAELTLIQYLPTEAMEIVIYLIVSILFWYSEKTGFTLEYKYCSL